MTDDDIGGYRYSDLEAAGIIKSRQDLTRKQREHGFPLSVKLGKRQAWFPRAEVQSWIKKRIELRDQEVRKQAVTP